MNYVNSIPISMLRQHINLKGNKLLIDFGVYKLKVVNDYRKFCVFFLSVSQICLLRLALKVGPTWNSFCITYLRVIAGAAVGI